MTTNENLKQPVATVMGSYGYGWQQMWKYFLHFFLILIIVGLISAPVSLIQDYDGGFSASNVMLQIFAAGYMLMILPIFSFGSDLLYLRGIRNEKIDFGELIIGFKENYLNIILANLLTFAIVGIGFVFLIVPGIILACRLSFVPLLVMDKKMDAVAAVEKSWTMTRGHGWKIFGLFLMAIPIFIAGIICLIVGALFAVIWISTAFTALYHAIDIEQNKELDDDTIVAE
jgi:hypothetical protein